MGGERKKIEDRLESEKKLLKIRTDLCEESLISCRALEALLAITKEEESNG